MDRQSDVAVLDRNNEPYFQAVLDVFNQRQMPTEEADVLVASLEGLNLGRASATAAGVPRLSGRGLQLTDGAAGAVAYNSANEYGVEIDYSLIPHDASPRLSTQVGLSAQESIWDGVKGIYNSLVVNNLDFIGAGSKLLYERSLFGYALQAGHKMLGLDAPSFDVSPIRAEYRSPYGTLSERAKDVAQLLGGGYGLLKSFGLGLKSESAVAALTYSSDADASPLSAARRLISAVLGDSGELVRMTNSGVAVIRIGEMTYGQIGGLVVNRGSAAVRNDLAALRDMEPIIGSVQRAGQEIANGATFGKLSPEWRGALDIARVKYVKEPWITTRLEWAALGGYVDRGIGLRIENRLIPEAAGFVKNRIGPDLTKPGLLPIEVTRYAPSLNAIMTHAQRYNQSLAYSLYTKSGLGLKP